MLVQLTAAQMAVKVGISERSIQRWMQEGRLQAKKIEDSSLYEVESTDLERLRLRGHREEESRLQAVERKVTEMRRDLDAAIFHHEDQLAALERKFTDQAKQIAELNAALRIATEQLERLATASLSELETQLHDIRAVYHSKLLEYDPALLKALTARVEALEQRLSTPATTPGTPETATKPKTPRAQPTRLAEAVGKSSELPSDLVSARAFAGKHGIHENTLDKAINSGRLPVERGRWKDGAFWVQKALDEQGRARFVELYRSNPHFHQCSDLECPCHEYMDIPAGDNDASTTKEHTGTIEERWNETQDEEKDLDGQGQEG